MMKLSVGKNVRSVAIGPPKQQREVYAGHNGYEFSVPGLKKAGDVKVFGASGDARIGLTSDYFDGKAHEYAIDDAEFEGFVTRTDGTDFTITPTKSLGYGGKKSPAREKPAQQRAVPAGLKEFYVGSNNTTPDWTHRTLQSAVAHATRLVEAGGQDEAFVVRIMRVVKRGSPPINVEAFEGGEGGEFVVRAAMDPADPADLRSRMNAAILKDPVIGPRLGLGFGPPTRTRCLDAIREDPRERRELDERIESGPGIL